MIVPMCMNCLKDYEMDPPALQTNSTTCACCDDRFITAGWVSGEVIDRFNQPEEPDTGKYQPGG